MNESDEKPFNLEAAIDELRQTVADNLYRYRDMLNLTQDELAEIADMSLNGVQKIETKKAWFSIESIVKISHALAVTPAQLLLNSRKEQLVPLDEFSAVVGAFINSMTGSTVTITLPTESERPTYTITNTKRNLEH